MSRSAYLPDQMIAPFVKTTIVAAALACATLCAAAPAQPVSPRPQECKPASYPPDALRRREAGITVLGFLIGKDGAVRDTVLIASSGSASLDRAAQAALSTCAFKPGTQDGVPVLSWFPVVYTWTLDDDPDMLRVKAALAKALRENRDDADVLYRLSVLSTARAKTDAERARGFALLRRAAELGKAHAQFELGRRYERGEGVAPDVDAALAWYGKAVAQGEVFAVDRLGFGALTY